MAKPVVAIVGRPNVGKSTLFNKLIGTRLSIVDDTPGVTRDRIYGDCEWLNHKFLLVDTGGIEPDTSDVILSQMRTQAEIAISTADVIILVTNIRDGVVASDYDVATMLQKSGKPIILCVNKCDSIGEPDPEFYEFYNLGLGDPVAVSAAHGHGTGDLPTFGLPIMATLITSSSSSSSSFSGRYLRTSSSKSPVPWPCAAETATGSPKPRL